MTNGIIAFANPFGFDGASRMTNVSDGTYSASYGYLANSSLITNITFRQNATTRMITSKTFDNLNRLLSISSVASNTVSSTYAYNDANQRIRNVQADGSFWVYQYDALGQVTSGKKYWSDWTPVAAQQFEYAFDDIGNRTATKAGGDSTGANLRSATYSANNLNQYTSRTVPSAADLIGIANAGATVTVNGQSTYRRGEYFQKTLNIDNSVTNVWQVVSNFATLSGTNQTNAGNLFLPKNPENFGCDADGNLTSDGRWSLVWNGENRLIQMISTNVVDAAKRKLDFVYDARGRRIGKTAAVWNAGAWQTNLNQKFVYDDWNLVAIVNSAIALSSFYMWGLDLSGTMQGAGGVGGLLAVTSAGNGTHFAAMDGNGNISSLVSAADASTSAQYEYGPFAELLRTTGTMARLNAFRFSTKYQDDETELLYYGYRYYTASTGRWQSPDPIGEDGGLNIYNFVRNGAVSVSDTLGLRIGNFTVIDDTPFGNWSHAGIDVRMRWSPPAEWTKDCPCKRAVWVQKYSYVLKKTGLGITSKVPWKHDWDETDFAGNSDMWENKFPRGSRNDTLDMWDAPEVSSPTYIWTKSMDFQAETCVKCLEGLDKGKYYGCAQWGYLYDAYKTYFPSPRRVTPYAVTYTDSPTH